MKVTGPLFSVKAAGTLAGNVIFRRTARTHAVYRHFKPKQPGTPAQAAHQALFRLLANRWYFFTPAERNHWTELANSLRITRFNAYLRYHLRTLNPAATDGLIMWWPNLIPTGDVLHDLTANHKDGTFESTNGEPNWVYDGARRRYVLDYPGHGYVDVPDPANVTGPFSCTTWFRLHSFVNTSSFIDTHVGVGYVLGYHWFVGDVGKLSMRVRGQAAYSTTDFADDTDWHHIAGTWDGSKIDLYIDGTWEHFRNQPAEVEPQQMLWIGRRGVPEPHSCFNGRLDDTRVYNRLITETEISQLAAR